MLIVLGSALAQSPRAMAQDSAPSISRPASVVDVATAQQATLTLASDASAGATVISVTAGGKAEWDFPDGLGLTVDGQSVVLSGAVSATGVTQSLTLASGLPLAALTGAAVTHNATLTFSLIGAPGKTVTREAVHGDADARIKVGDQSWTHAGPRPQEGDVTSAGQRVVMVADVGGPDSGTYRVYLRGKA